MPSRMMWGCRLLSILLLLTAAGPIPAATPAATSKTATSPDRDRPASTQAQQGGLAGRIQRIVAGAGGMRVGIRVVALGREPAVVYEQNADQPLKPASNQKIITTAAAMTLLSADFSYRTLLAQRGPNLLIIGAGDPSIGDPQMAKAAGEPITRLFRDWAQTLKAKGLTSISGNLLYDDYIFEQEHLNPNWRRQFNLQDWYTAPAGGLNFNDNCVDVLVKPGQPGGPVAVTLVPGNTCIKVENRAKSGGKGQPIIQRSNADPRTIIVSGSVSRGNSDPESAPSIAVPDPGELFASACRTVFASQGIEIRGQTLRQRVRAADGTLPADLKILAAYEHPLRDVLWRVNKSSLNMFAETILKTVGAYAGREARPGVGSYESGRTLVQQFLTRLGVPPGTCVIDDGSGLSHENRATAAAFTTVLAYMDRSPRREEWWDNLAVPGEKIGTLRRRMQTLAGKVFAKTGSIRGVSALSGYVKGPGDRTYAFSILCNDTHRAKVSPHALQDEVCRTLATWNGP